MPVRVIVVMGVSGCGKSTVGKLLAENLQCDFLEGDSLHPASNVAKMSSGVPLTDADRMPWLQALHTKIEENLIQGRRLVLSCSALKPAYRHVLQYGVPQPGIPSVHSRPTTTFESSGAGAASGTPSSGGSTSASSATNGVCELRVDRAAEVVFVLLDPDPAELRRRLDARDRAGGHFMPASLLESQLATLSYKEDELFAHIRGDGDGGGGGWHGRGVGGAGSTAAADALRAPDTMAPDSGGDAVRQAHCVFPDPRAIVDMLLPRLGSWTVQERTEHRL